MSTLLLATVALPGLAALLAFLASGSSRSDRVSRIGVVLNGLAFAGAVALLVVVWAGDPVSAAIESGDGLAVAGLYADRLVAVLLILVTGVSVIVQAFSTRYLRGDLQAIRFFAGANLLTFATAVMISSASLIGRRPT